MKTNIRLMILKMLSIVWLILSVPASAQAPEVREAEWVTTQRVRLENASSIHVKKTFGEVEIEGWDQPEVEITLTRKTQKKYPAAEQADRIARLQRIQIRLSRESEGGLLIETQNMPFSKNNLQLLYKIKVPQNIFLKVSHGIGEVTVTNVLGDLDVRVSIGEIRLRLPDTQLYSLDARARIGDVASEFGGESSQQHLIGQQLTKDSGRVEPVRLFLRVGIGDIQVTRLPRPN